MPARGINQTASVSLDTLEAYARDPAHFKRAMNSASERARDARAAEANATAALRDTNKALDQLAADREAHTKAVDEHKDHVKREDGRITKATAANDEERDRLDDRDVAMDDRDKAQDDRDAEQDKRDKTMGISNAAQDGRSTALDRRKEHLDERETAIAARETKLADDLRDLSTRMEGFALSA